MSLLLKVYASAGPSREKACKFRDKIRYNQTFYALVPKAPVHFFGKTYTL